MMISNTKDIFPLQRVYTWLLRFWKEYPIAMLSVLALTVLTTAARAAFPLLLRHIIEMLQHKYALQEIYQVLWLYMAAGAVHELLARGLPLSRALMNLRLAAAIRMHYFGCILRRHFDFFNSYTTGDLLTRLTDDIDGQWDRIAWYSCSGVMRPVEAALVLLFTLGIMVSESPLLSIISFAPLPILVYLLAASQNALRKSTDARQAAASACTEALENCFTGIRVIKATGGEQEQAARYTELLEQRAKAELDFLKRNQKVQFLTMLVNHTGTVIVIIAGGAMVLQNYVSMGTFLLFLIYLERLIEPVQTLSVSYSSTNQADRYMQRLSELEYIGDRPAISAVQQPAAIIYPKDEPVLEMNTVSFRYGQHTLPIANRINLQLKRGEYCAVIGPVGSGKTTLLHLAAGILRPDEGDILLYGSAPWEYNHTDKARVMGYAFQKPVLFSENIITNIALSEEPDTEDPRLANALHASRLINDTARLQGNIHTPLGQRGLTLSGGQQQRLGLARTFFHRPGLLLLDDPTAAMDAGTEAEFWNEIRSVYPDATVLYTTHRAATMLRCDTVYHLEHGILKPLSKKQALEIMS
jgi:ATP-binding cassette subfamily B protein